VYQETGVDKTVSFVMAFFSMEPNGVQADARAGIGKWIDFYNRLRPHTALGGITPNMYHKQHLLKAA
jgi:transposase InsO family protein